MNRNKFTKWLSNSYVLLIIITVLIASVYGMSRINVSGEPVQYLYSIFLSSLLLIAGVATVLVAYRPFKKKSVKIGTFLLLFAYGIAVYVRYYEVKESCTFSTDFSYMLAFIDNTLSVFFPSRGAYEELMNYSSVFKFHFYLFHLLTYIYGALIVLSLFAGKMMNRFQQYYYRKNRCLFFGADEPSKLLAKDILKNDPHTGCFFYISEKRENDKELFEQLDELGAIVFYVDFENDKTNYAKYNISRYFFLDEDQDFNVRMALQVVESLPTKKIKEPHLYIRTETERIDNFFKGKPQTVEIHLFNQSDLTARFFVKEHPMLDCQEEKIQNKKINPETLLVDYNFNLLLLGFGWAGRELLKKCICDAQFKGSTFKATVIDEALETKYGYYPVLYDECIENYNLDLISITIGSKAFYEWITKNLKPFNRIIVALGDDKTNIDIAIILARILQAKGTSEQDIKNTVFAHVREKKKFGYYKRKDINNKDISPITIFGSIEEIYTQKIVVQETLDKVAKEMNFKWADKNKYQTAESAWQAASIFDQDSSRGSAMGIYNTLRLMGLESVNKEKADVCEEDFKTRIASCIDTLATNEHNRWNAFHFTNGIRRWDISKVDYVFFKDKKLKANQIKAFNAHAALIDYDQLPEKTDAVINEFIKRWNKEHPDENPLSIVNNQKIDRDFIEGIPDFLRSINCVIIKQKNDEQA